MRSWNIMFSHLCRSDQINKLQSIGCTNTGFRKRFASTADGCMMEILIQEKQQLEREQPRSHHRRLNSILLLSQQPPFPMAIMHLSEPSLFST